MQGVANRDIKLENTLLDGSPRPLVKICDFGYSKVRLLILADLILADLLHSREAVDCMMAPRMDAYEVLALLCSTRSSSQHPAPGSAPQHTWPQRSL